MLLCPAYAQERFCSGKENHWKDNQEQWYFHLPYNLPGAGLIEIEKKKPKVLNMGGKGHSQGL